MVEHLSSKHKTQSSTPVPPKKKKKRKNVKIEVQSQPGKIAGDTISKNPIIKKGCRYRP
jgi:hypothetical protein